ncbi:hypothetical protein BDZ94DRAFT_1261137 [Collybia nuda]|uniref:Uncharacterized protein n=1 Tax=Collybia nuda TaxID=64659 RepID=A0A9P5Y5A5_9AGAR|nr:hypothetical protein BDZ94DRAFT_1261137 [Collybia nuda]
MGGGSTTVANNQSSESEKRRKQTVERAKANHLSRQLQMRLQYARLKVDHGWQKQNLNEVENLYFRHSHQRGPKPYPTPLIATTQRDPPFPPSITNNTNQSSLSFKLGPSHLSRSQTSAELALSSDDQSSVGLSVSVSSTSFASLPSPLVIPSPSGSVHMNSPTNPADSSSLVPMAVGEPKRSPTSSTFPQTVTPPIITSPPPDFPAARSNSMSNTHSPRNSSSPVPTWSAGSGPTSISKHYSRQPQAHPLPSPPADTYGFSNSTSNLTYDSFWSAHSTSAASRPFRNSTGNALVDVSGGTPPQVDETTGEKGGENNGSVVNTAKGGGRRKATGSRSTAGRES